jgi:hypothetical protein
MADTEESLFFCYVVHVTEYYLSMDSIIPRRESESYKIAFFTTSEPCRHVWELRNVENNLCREYSPSGLNPFGAIALTESFKVLLKLDNHGNITKEKPYNYGVKHVWDTTLFGFSKNREEGLNLVKEYTEGKYREAFNSAYKDLIK